MAMAKLREQLRQAKEEVKIRRESVLLKRTELLDTTIATYAQQSGHSTIMFDRQEFSCCRTLQGHTGKIYSLDWAQGKDHVVSASQDGHLIVWNALTSQKKHVIKLACPWVMTCAFSPSGLAVACGGLDSVCSIYKLNTLSTHQCSDLPGSTLSGHKGYVSCCKFIPERDNQILTSSGDRTCILWDSELGEKISIFGGDSSAGHSSDVMSLSISPENPQQFLSGSCDQTARLWDVRDCGRPVQICRGHEADVNTVQFFPDGIRFGTGSDDSTCRIFDTRTGHEMQKYDPNEIKKANSIGFSRSGRLIFAAYSNGDCYIWDTLTAEVITNLRNRSDSHTQLISCLSLASDGSALCTGSWDQNLKIWACGHEQERNINTRC